MTETANLRFVILHHQLPAADNGQVNEHWDFMLEDDGILLTWAIAERPETGKRIAAKRLEKHRMKYLDYEGPGSNNRGAVTQFLSGTFEWQRRDENGILVRLNAESDFDSVEFFVDGERYECEFSSRET